MPQHRSPRISEALAAPGLTEVTDIIPFDEFGELGDLDDLPYGAFDRDTEVIRAPELDDLLDTDDLEPLRLVPSEFRAARTEARTSSTRAYRDSHTDLSDGTAKTDIIDMRGRKGLHRKTEVPVKGRLMVAAMAVGATAAGAYTVTNAAQKQPTATVLAADTTTTGGASVITGSVDGMQVVTVAPAADSAVHAEEITKAAAFAQERADREARLARPQYVMPTRGVWTSGFGYRWGVLHAGIDIANSIGTPIYAAADGVVTDAGPTAGYGAWVKVRHSDGTVTLYGHVNTWLVSVGQRVMAGDQIATIGNRGNSTGPHLHFSVLVNGTDFIDPVPWLAKRGLTPGSYVG
ncbi:murein DD-endopeptidase MepM/ murein hydrolase activator NlpD [Mycobacterium sp. BK558]|uniref:Murein DD-endopeptidase MepM n=1 Tax=Mycolicibacterium chlorophenolicum TaxID=37916 RepID=A0A0J6V9S1_9MYCO|nr:M23 family metallopeptidase [Mycolicibacterium chlorophenolicum]KMO67625.1 Murein DD-endopeptidase MepM [Mycolicibacterium chlorophenolicum]RZT25736.1 murein DD-endopeptidase MepM/ murein hydrolase activator NlpD [Mycobacterium sp. BK558]